MSKCLGTCPKCGAASKQFGRFGVSRYLCDNCAKLALNEYGLDISKPIYFLLTKSKGGYQTYRVVNGMVTDVEYYKRYKDQEYETKVVIKRPEITTLYYRLLDELASSEEACLEKNKSTINNSLKKIIKGRILDIIEPYIDNHFANPETTIKDVIENEFIDTVITDCKDMIDTNRELLEAEKQYKKEIKNKKQIIEDKQQDIKDAKFQRDLMVMAQQDIIYKQIEAFIKSDLAKEFKITGIDVTTENGYVNAMWKFGNK